MTANEIAENLSEGTVLEGPFWTVAQAISEVLPEGDKEKQLLQGLLNQRDGIEKAVRDERLF